MKLRCTTNSIRIRLRKSDIEVLKKNQIIEDLIEFPGSDRLQYAVCISDNAELYASYVNHEIVVFLPKKMATQWIESNQVSLENNISTVERKGLSILIEKDFPCLDRDDADRDDTFWELADDKSKTND